MFILRVVSLYGFSCNFVTAQSHQYKLDLICPILQISRTDNDIVSCLRKITLDFIFFYKLTHVPFIYSSLFAV